MLCTSIAISFLLLDYFNLFGSKIDGKNILKAVLATAIPLGGLYFCLYFVHSKKLANQIGGGLAVFLVIAYILGFLLH